MSVRVPREGREILDVLRQIDKGTTWSGLGKKRLTAQMMMNRGYVENERTGKGFGDVKPRLTKKAHKFRQFY